MVVADDSPVVRELLVRVINSEPDMVVVGEAGSGDEVVDLAVKHRPDLITMDVEMPGLDGVGATAKIMSIAPTSIVAVTARPTGRRSDTAFRVMGAGGVDAIPKPGAEVFGGPSPERSAFVRRLRVLAGVLVLTRRGGATSSPPVPRHEVPPVIARRYAQVIAIGASTGGPPCIAEVLGGLGSAAPPVLISQHMAASFVPGFVRWLGGCLSRPVELAASGRKLQRGHVYVAPGDGHLRLVDRTTIAIDRSGPVEGLQPSVDVMFRSVAERFAAGGLGVLLTGMGRDGADGMTLMREAGAFTVAQDRATSLVYGMPAAAWEAGAASYSASSGGIARLLARVELGDVERTKPTNG